VIIHHETLNAKRGAFRGKRPGKRTMESASVVSNGGRNKEGRRGKPRESASVCETHVMKKIIR